ncbi:MAG: DNA polymerase III subunit delta [Treponema sp.]|nr:DNA polymerase III subunit delta [Treponema sp.]
MSCPIYLYTGPEAGERAEAIAKLKNAAIKKYGSIDEYKYYCSDVRLKEVIEQLQNGNLFSSFTFVVLYNTELLKTKEDIALLKSSVSSLSSANLILVSDEISIDKKIEALIPKENKKIFWEMFDNRKEGWILNLYKKNGYGITPDGIQLLLDYVENNTEALRNASTVVFNCFPQGHVVTEKEIETILSHNKEESAFTLFDAMTDINSSVSRRFEYSLDIIQKLLLLKSASASGIIAGLSYCFKMLKSWLEIQENGYVSDLDLKSHGFSSKKARERYAAASKIWSLNQVASILIILSSTDMELRSSTSFSTETMMFILIYEIVIKNGNPCMQYENVL